MAFKNIIVQQNGGGGGSGNGSGGFVDDFSLEIKADDINASQQEDVSFEIEANYDDSVAQQNDNVNFGFEGFAESNATPTEERESSMTRFARGSRGQAANPNGALDDSPTTFAQVKAGGVLGGFQSFETVVIPPFDDTENNPVAEVRYLVSQGVLDAASAGIFYFINTTAGDDAPITPYDLTFNAGTTNTDTSYTFSGNIENDDIYTGLGVSDAAQGPATGTFAANNGVSAPIKIAVNGTRAAFLFEYSLTTADRNKTVDHQTGVGAAGVAGATANHSAGVFIRGVSNGGGQGTGIDFDFVEQNIVNTTASTPLTFTLPQVNSQRDNALIVYYVGFGGSNPPNGTPTSGQFNQDIITRVNRGVSGGSTSLATVMIGSVVQPTSGLSANRTFTINNIGANKGLYMAAYAFYPDTADGTPALVLQDLPSTGVFNNGLNVPLNNIDTNSEVFFRFTHGALLPLLGGEVRVFRTVLNSEDVL